MAQGMAKFTAPHPSVPPNACHVAEIFYFLAVASLKY
jgi:hypothetical protein